MCPWPAGAAPEVCHIPCWLALFDHINYVYHGLAGPKLFTLQVVDFQDFSLQPSAFSLSPNRFDSL